MNYTDVQKLLSNSAIITGPSLAICNGVNTLATGVRKRHIDQTGTIEGVVATTNSTERVVITSLEASLLVVVSIAELMGISVHDNLLTANPNLHAEFLRLLNTGFFKTYIDSLQNVAGTYIENNAAKFKEGAPAFLDDQGNLYISGDLLEMVFESLREAGAFNTSSGTFTPLELPEAGQVENYQLSTTNLNLAQFEELLNNRWADFQALATDSHSSSAPVAYPILNFNSFTEFLAQLRDVMGDTDYNSIFNNFNGGYFHAQKRDGRYNYFDYNLMIITTPLSVLDYPILNYNGFGRDGYYLVGNSYYDTSNFFTGHYIKLTYNNGAWELTNSGGSYSVYTANGTNFIAGGDYYTYAGEWSFYQYEQGGGDTPEGITQQEGATLPTSETGSFTAWAESNLPTWASTKLTTNAPASQNSPAHTQNWYPISLDYTAGYTANLNGESEEPAGGFRTQANATVETQQEQTEDAGITGTGTNIEEIINIYNGTSGSEEETEGQEDDGTITDDGVPTEAWNATGATGIYCPTEAQMTTISNWLWTTNFTDVIEQFFQDPAEAQIGLFRCYLPFTTTGSAEVVFGRVGSGVNVATANKYQQHDAGTVGVDKFYHNYLDFEAQVSIYVPFCGFQALDIRDIMGATLDLQYKWDMMSGQGVAELWVNRDEMNAPLYQWPINAFEQIPLSSSSLANHLLATAGMLTSTIAGTAAGFMAGGPIGGVIGGGIAGATGIANMHNSQHVNQGGSITGNAAAVACKTPFLTIRYPKNASPVGFEEFNGIGTDTVATIGSFSGFIKCQEVHLEGGGGISKAEMEQIEAILKEGVLV